MGTPPQDEPPAISLEFREFRKRDTEQSIASRFEEIVAIFPGRPAISCPGTSWTYRELDRRAAAIAHAILARRPRTTEAVALMLPNGADLAAAIVAVLKAGKFYLGIEPGSEPARMKEMLDDSGAALIVTSHDRVAEARALAGDALAILAIEGVEPDPVRARADSPPQSPDDLAYLFYTSGTTGRPKGVVDNQRNVLHNIMRYTNTLRICAQDRLSLLQSASFSGAVSSLFGALLNGACSCPYEPRGRTTAQLAGWLTGERVSIYHSVPSIFRHVVAGADSFPDVRIVRLEGDQSMRGDLDLFARRFGKDARLVNGLGTTETGLVRQFFASGSTRVSTPVVPVGYAVEDMEAIVVGDDAQLLPHGEVGEIAVRSRYLAVGYWNNPALTAQRFRADPGDSGLRTYLTGDLGRMQDDGCLEHLGRKDTRIKLRGQAVELIQVEAALAELPALRDAAAAVHLDAGDRQVLVAYYVAAQPPGPTVSELRKALQRTLPAFMVPTAFVELPVLPRNENGKLDRASLPPPATQRPRLGTDCLAPRNMLEHQLASIWQRVLGVAPLGVRDDFFDVGGDSLAAMTMASFVEEELGVALSPDQLLRHATIEQLAGSIRAGEAGTPSPLVELQAGNGGPPLFYLHGDYLSGGYYARKLARAIGPDVRFIAVTPCGANGAPAPATFDEMADLHLPALRAIQPHGPYFLGGTCNGGLIAFEIARRLSAMGENVALLALFAASAGNLRYRGLARLAHALCRLRGHPAARERAVFVRLRGIAVNFARLGTLAAARRALATASRAPAKIRSALGRDTHTPVPAVPDIGECYSIAEACYMPRAYDGRLVILWPEGEPDDAVQARDWWRRVARSVEVKPLASAHQACLTADAHLLAAALADAFAEANRPVQAG